VSRFLVTLWPFTGHLLPQMAIAGTLRERGHEVAFFSGEAVREHVESEGFELFAFERLDRNGRFATCALSRQAGGSAPCCTTGSSRRSRTS
jgi:UDP:flavonoid glycosyltransferase YjiC (YdhE family)